MALRWRIVNSERSKRRRVGVREVSGVTSRYHDALGGVREPEAPSGVEGGEYSRVLTTLAPLGERAARRAG